MFYYVYALKSEKDGSLYIGYTVNLEKRLKEHSQGKNVSTKSKLPWICIYYEACLDSNDAKRRESYLKTSGGQTMLKLRLKQYLYKHGSRNIG